GNVMVGLVCPTSDVSGGGAKVISAMEMQIGTELPLSLKGLLRAIGAKVSKAEANGIVRRCEQMGNQWAYGLQFDKLDGEIRREIMKWCLSGSWEEVPIVE
ncbi:MAG TPA: PilZ domain-containing protein, partial [bacterium]|nr:PilZ domain-containing protein [bacterium]